MTYKLFDQPLPTFIAGAFAQKAKGTEGARPPTRTAFGPNILGFVMYNTFAPTCAQVDNERAAAHRGAVVRRLQHDPDPPRSTARPARAGQTITNSICCLSDSTVVSYFRQRAAAFSRDLTIRFTIAS